MVYYSISAREKAGLAFYETPTTEFPRLSTKLSSSSKVDRFLAGASISQRTHQIVCLWCIGQEYPEMVGHFDTHLREKLDPLQTYEKHTEISANF